MENPAQQPVHRWKIRLSNANSSTDLAEKLTRRYPQICSANFDREKLPNCVSKEICPLHNVVEAVSRTLDALFYEVGRQAANLAMEESRKQGSSFSLGITTTATTLVVLIKIVSDAKSSWSRFSCCFRSCSGSRS